MSGLMTPGDHVPVRYAITYVAVFSNDGFITMTSGSAGTGNGSVSYTVLPNTGLSRTGTVTIAGQTFTIIQAGGATPVQGDFSGDGAPDLVWQDDTTRHVTVHYYGGAQGAVFQGWNYLNAGGIPGWKVVGAADFNGDGVPDRLGERGIAR